MNRIFLSGLMLAILVAVADQASKAWLMTILPAPGTGRLIWPFFDLVFLQNKGVSFSLLAARDARLALIVVTIAVMLFLLAWLRKAEGRLVPLALGLIVGGAGGNLIDRIRLGAVTDFLDVHWGLHHWPAFNLADSAIVTGVGLLLLESLLANHRKNPDGTS